MFNVKKIIKSKKGQTMVETALILPVILLILLGIMEFGRLFSNYLIVSNASREGARYAALGKSDTQIQSVIEDLFVSTGLCESGSFGSVATITKGTYADSVEIKVEYNYNVITPIVGPLISGGNPIKLTSATRMRLETGGSL